MRENICLILNAKNKKDALEEMHQTIDLFREDCNLNTEYELDKRYWTKSYFKKEYENKKQEYRNLSQENINKRLERSGLNNIEEYIDFVFKTFGWNTLEDYVKKVYNVVRFEGEACIGLYNPIGYIDYVDRIITLKKYKNLSSSNMKKHNVAKLVYKNKEYLDWDVNKDYKTNKMLLNQALRREASNNDYIALVRVHF